MFRSRINFTDLQCFAVPVTLRITRLERVEFPSGDRTWTDDGGISDDSRVRRFGSSLRLGFVFNRKFLHHTHEDDAVEIRLWRALFSNGVVCRRNVSFHRLQQLHRGRQWIDVKTRIDFRIDSFRSSRPSMSSMIFPSRRELVCGVAHRVRSRTEKMREYVRCCLMDFRHDELDGSQKYEMAFPNGSKF